jgi:hypothetical protein
MASHQAGLFSCATPAPLSFALVILCESFCSSPFELLLPVASHCVDLSVDHFELILIVEAFALKAF